ncbi:MAG: secretion system protein [Anaerolineaceae bacterium]|nr:secretion system protein [Anaerolineaceae bacterium]
MDQTVVLVGAGILALIVLLIGIRNVRANRDVVEERLGRYDESNFQSFLDETDDENYEPDKPTAIESAINNALSDRPFAAKWRQQLARADIKLTVAEYAAIHIISMIGFFVVGYFVLFGQQLVMGIVSGFVGFFAPRIYVARQTSKRLIDFEQQLPDTLSLWVNALRSGYSVLQAMEAISRDAPEPTGTEFKRVVQEVSIGIDTDDAMQHMLDRVESEDLDLVVTAVNIQREVGGNLAEILEIISHVIRERIKLKGEIRVLTAQGRITGYLISGLPILLALFLYAINPTYMANLFENRACGWPLLGIGLALIGIGSAVVQKIVQIEI